MAKVYVLRGTTGRYYIGATTDLEARVEAHSAGRVYSTKRLGLPLELVVAREFRTMGEALSMECRLKRWKNPAKVIEFLKAMDSDRDCI